MGVVESLTCTVKPKVPAAFGVPEITPPEARLSPEGSDPEATVHEYGACPRMR
jgi:hypothetical protein